ncbi:MAG: aminotransferase class I/II-fold pyridoxal phosphate-dependent enzyme [Chitinivibrionales bacterium]|nr:aminotransferase class I/II-fold pyridoxal phosphate-dependent enzyme [Chitinivibrionales bacterium]
MSEKNLTKIQELIDEQNSWRSQCINLIASENVASERVRAAMGSDFMHRYAEGHPGQRYYQGTRCIDEIESIVTESMKSIFNCKHADVRSVSGTNANEAVFSKMIGYNDVIMVNSTPGGGHISHHRFGAAGKYTRNIIDFPLTADGYHIDVAKTEEIITIARPKVLIFGKSLFLFPDPVADLKEICEKNKITVIFDAAHVLGLIAGGKFQQPLKEGAQVMLGSTHKTFFGSQRGVILSDTDDEKFWNRIDKGAFPGSHSNHHLATLAGLALATEELDTFGADYADQVIKNAQALGAAMDKAGFDVQAKEFGYTQSHQIAVNLEKIGGGKAGGEKLEENDIICNMNLLPFEPVRKVTKPAGVRIGTSEMTRVGMKEDEMAQIADLMKACLIDGKSVKADVNTFRQKFQKIHYSFD